MRNSPMSIYLPELGLDACAVALSTPEGKANTRLVRDVEWRMHAGGGGSGSPWPEEAPSWPWRLSPSKGSGQGHCIPALIIPTASEGR